jgi:hypothetical protein
MFKPYFAFSSHNNTHNLLKVGPRPVSSSSARHTLSFAPQLDLALKFNLHPPRSLASELLPYESNELKYATAVSKKNTNVAQVSHGYAEEVQQLLMAGGGGGGEDTPRSLSKLPVLPGRVVPDAMMVNEVGVY